MALRDVLLKTFVLPVWVAGPPKVEQWTCPACAAEVDRISPAWKGVWFTAEPGEVTALCSRTHRTHDRKGQPFPVDEPLAGVEDWIPIVAVDAAPGGPPVSFVALLPPHGVAFVLATDGDDDGTAYELRRLEELAASDLLGPRAASLRGEVIGRVAVEEVVFDDLRAVRVVAELGLAVGDAPAGDALEGGERPADVRHLLEGQPALDHVPGGHRAGSAAVRVELR